MLQSEKINELAKALVLAQSQLLPVEKDAKNPHFGNTYASLTAVIAATRGVLSEQGLVVVQTHDESAEGKSVLVTTLLHSSGQFISARLPLVLNKQDMQAVGSATSYARRYGLLAILNLGAEDDDGHAAVKHHAPESTPRPFPAAPHAAPAHPAAAMNPGQDVVKGYGSEPQMKRLWAICKSSGWTDRDVNEYLKREYGVASKLHIPNRHVYDDLCKFIESHKGGPPRHEGPPPPSDDDVPF